MKLWRRVAAISALGLALSAQNPPKPVPPPQADEPHPHPGRRYARQHALHRHRQEGPLHHRSRPRTTSRSSRTRSRRTIPEFTAESDLPLRIAILIDTSNSIRDRFRFEQEAASEFIKSRHQGRSRTRPWSSASTPQPNCAADLIDDTNILEKAIRDLRPGGGTALYDAIYFACRTSCSTTSRATSSAAPSSC